jgi:ribosomal protein L18
VKLFQIEEPEGGPADTNAPGAAIGIDATGSEAQVAVSVGGNAVLLADREGVERALPVPAGAGNEAEWRQLLEAAKVTAERALVRPVTHAVVVLAEVAEAGIAARLYDAASEAGLEILRVLTKSELPDGSNPALAAAMLAEDLAPRPG